MAQPTQSCPPASAGLLPSCPALALDQRRAVRRGTGLMMATAIPSLSSPDPRVQFWQMLFPADKMQKIELPLLRFPHQMMGGQRLNGWQKYMSPCSVSSSAAAFHMKYTFFSITAVIYAVGLEPSTDRHRSKNATTSGWMVGFRWTSLSNNQAVNSSTTVVQDCGLIHIVDNDGCLERKLCHVLQANVKMQIQKRLILFIHQCDRAKF